MKLTSIIKHLKEANQWEFNNEKEIQTAVESIYKEQQKLEQYMKKVDFRALCKKCQSVCCASFMPKVAFSLPEVLYYVAKMNPEVEEQCMGKVFLKGRCALLTEKGCILSPTGKPKICISYFCQFPYKKDTIPLITELARRFYDLKVLMEKGRKE